MKKEWIDVISYTGDGYKPLIDFEAWRVAVLRYCEELEVQNISSMQYHGETDEVFVLLEGSCTLFTGGNEDCIGDISGIKMEPLKLYNVKQGVWHTHTLEKDSTVLIVENQDTSDANSPVQLLSEEQKKELIRVFHSIDAWKERFNLSKEY